MRFAACWATGRMRNNFRLLWIKAMLKIFQSAYGLQALSALLSYGGIKKDGPLEGPENSGLLVKVFRDAVKIQAITVQLVTLGQVMRSSDKAAGHGRQDGNNL